MSDISRGDRRVTRERDPGNLCIAKIDGTSRFLPIRGERCRFVCRRAIEVQYAILQVFVQHSREQLL